MAGVRLTRTCALLAVSYCASAGVALGETWTSRGFDAFAKGSFSGAGQNIYVSSRGRVQLINRLDLNGDGHIDIVIGNGHPKTEKEDVFLYPNRGGDFNPLDRVPLPADGAEAAAIADLDEDGFNDLVLAQRDNGITPRLNAFIYFGGKDGFTPGRRLELPAFAASDVAVADFNGDGRIDLAFACANEGSDGPVTTVYWNSAGGFAAARRQDFPGAGWQTLAAADWDGDGTSDLVAATSKAVLLYRGGTDGLLPAESLSDTGGEALAIADWNGDGRPDLAAANRRALRFHLHEEAGGPPTLSVEVANVSGLAWADFDLDRRQDLLVAVHDIAGNEFTDSFILWNGPDGLDRRARTKLPTVAAECAGAADLDGDGYPEAVLGNHRAYNQNNIQSFVYWSSKGQFYQGRKTMLDTRGVSDVAIGDVNSDGRLDLVFVNTTGGRHEGWSPNFIYWGDGTRDYSVERRTQIPSYYTTGSVQADLNDDGWVDLGFNEGRYAAGRPPTLHGLYLWWGGPEGYSAEQRTILSGYDPAGGVKTADLNRDGWLDLLMGANDSNGGEKGGFVIFWGGADGYSVRRRQVFPIGSASREPLVADLNGDGYLDLAAPPTDLNGLYIYWGSADGYDRAPGQVLASDRQFAHPEAADLNGDGRIDLIAPTRKYKGDTEADSFIYYGSPGGFSEGNRVGLPTMAGYDPSVADLDQDGWLDIVFPNYSATRMGKRSIPIFIYWGSAEGFDRARRQELPADAGAGSMIADFDGDGWRDVFIACHRQDGSRDEAGRPHTHYADSLIYWNGPDGLDEKRRTLLPGVGPHAQTAVDVGNILTREMAAYYTSPAWKPSQDGARARRIAWEAETPHGTTVHFQVRTAATEAKLKTAPWVGPDGPDSWFETSGDQVSGTDGPWIQYRARLSTPNGGPTPYLISVSVEAMP